VGALTGLVGVGGGFLIVPALVLLARVPMKEAVGTSLLVIAMNSASGLTGYLGQVEVPWGFMALFTSVAIAGTFAGTHLARLVSADQLRRAFAGFLVVMGGLILYENRGVFLPDPGRGQGASIGIGRTMTPRQADETAVGVGPWGTGQANLALERGARTRDGGETR
jgi:hypothetical protein